MSKSDIVEEIRTKLNSLSENERNMRKAVAAAMGEAWSEIVKQHILLEPERSKRVNFALAHSLVFAVNMSLQSVADFYNADHQKMVKEFSSFARASESVRSWLLGRSHNPN